MMVELPYGRAPYKLELAGRTFHVVEPARLPSPPPVATLFDAALEAPVGGPQLAGPARVTLIVSDPSRDEPRAAFVQAIRRRLPGVRWTLAIATGTHGPCRVDELGLPDDLLAEATIVNHDGHRPDDLVSLGTTTRGTPVIVHRCVVETDLVVATGCIRPHYFAGFGAGVKAVFPGLGAAAAIRINHRMKSLPGARAGVVDGNPCRQDLEEAVALLATPVFLLDGVCGPDGAIHAAVAGDPVRAFRAGADQARPWFTVRAPRAPLVIASDCLPVSSSLYQAAKIAAAVAPLVEPGGALVLVAQCPLGTGPVDVVNEAIFRTGVVPRLAPGVELALVSGLDRPTTATTLLTYAASVNEVADRVPGPVLVIPRAGQLICEVDS
jgi:nickel-dependent lactate racemase